MDERLLGALLGGALGGEPGRLDGARVPHDPAVLDTHDARGVVLGELRVVRDHDDEAVAGNLGKQVHDLDARLGVKGSRGLVCQHDLWVVHKGAGDGHALHLSAGELGRSLVDVLAQAHALERRAGALAALGATDARQRERELDVLQDRLVGNEVVALEHEANAVVAVRVPVRIRVVSRGNAVHDDVARVRVVEAAQDVEKRRLARARGAEHGHELALSKRYGDAVERALHEVAGLV